MSLYYRVALLGMLAVSAPGAVITERNDHGNTLQPIGNVRLFVFAK